MTQFFPRPLRRQTIEFVAKTFYLAPTFNILPEISKDKEAHMRVLEAIKELRQHVTAPTLVPPKFYRHDVDQNDDSFLIETGFLHLHVGNSFSSELIWARQFTKHVVLYEVSYHDHFRIAPKGYALKAAHYEAEKQMWNDEYARRREAKLKKKGR